MNAPDSTTASLLRRRAASGDLWLSTSGESMGRRYRPGSRVLVRASPNRPRVGEVWAFVDAYDRVVVHRCVWSRSMGALRFRGDAVCSLDPPVSMGHLVGPVTEVDDGTRRWPPRPWHALSPTVRTFTQAVLSRLRRCCSRRFVKISSKQQGK